MFVRYFVDVHLPLAQAEEALLHSPGDWIPGIAQDAEDLGEHLLAEVGFGPDGRRVAKRVIIELGNPIRFPSRTVLPMSWRAAERQAFFPTFEADIEVAPLGPNRTQLSVSARYEPPLGVVGRAIDRALLHRVAEAIVKDFVDRLADRLQTLAPSNA